MSRSSHCRCLVAARGDLELVRDLGLDDHLAQVSLLACPECGTYWLRYSYEVEAFTGSGRWFLGTLPARQVLALTVASARETLEEEDCISTGEVILAAELARGRVRSGSILKRMHDGAQYSSGRRAEKKSMRGMRRRRR